MFFFSNYCRFIQNSSRVDLCHPVSPAVLVTTWLASTTSWCCAFEHFYYYSRSCWAFHRSQSHAVSDPTWAFAFRASRRYVRLPVCSSVQWRIQSPDDVRSLSVSRVLAIVHCCTAGHPRQSISSIRLPSRRPPKRLLLTGIHTAVVTR